MLVSSSIHGLHHVAQKLIITGLPSLLMEDVLKLSPLSVLTPTEGIVLPFSGDCAEAMNAMNANDKKMIENFFILFFECVNVIEYHEAEIKNGD